MYGFGCVARAFLANEQIDDPGGTLQLSDFRFWQQVCLRLYYRPIIPCYLVELVDKTTKRPWLLLRFRCLWREDVCKVTETAAQE